MNKLVAKLSQIQASRSELYDFENHSEQLQRKQLPFISIIGAQKVNLEKETSNFLQRGSLDSTGLLRAIENKDEAQNLSEKDKALYQIFNKNEINLRNSAEANVTIYILRKQVKNNLEMRFLQRVIENISIFKQNPGMTSNSLITNSLFKQLKHEFYPRRTVLFNYGDPGTKYYIVLKGSVYCLLPDNQLSEEQKASCKSLNLQQARPFTPQAQRQQQNSQENEEKDDNPKLLKVLQNLAAKKKTLALFSKLGMAQNFIDEIREEQALNDEEYMKKKFSNFTPVRQLGPGESFGEIALMTNKGRSATIVLKDDTHFMSLSKEGFNKVFSIYKAKIFDEQIEFLHNFSFFRELSKFSLLQLLYNIEIKVFLCKQVVYAEKDIADKIYFINRGEIEISKKYTLKETANEPEFNQNKFIQRKSLLKVINEEDNLIVEKQIEGSQDFKLQLKRENKIQKRIVISKQGPNSYFGEQEIVSGKELRETQAQCSSVSCEVYMLDKSKLKSILSEKDFILMVEESKSRVSYQAKRMEQAIDLKENQSEKMKDALKKLQKAEHEKKMLHSVNVIKQKRNTFHVDRSQYQEIQQKFEKQQMDAPQISNLVKGGIIISRERYPSNHISGFEDDSSIPLTPKSIFPVKKKSYLNSAKDSTINSFTTTTRLQSQSKPRFSVQSLFDNQSSLTHIGNIDTTPFKSPIISFTSTQIPVTNNKLKRTFTSEYSNNSYLNGLNSPKTPKILPINILSMNKKISQESEKENEKQSMDKNELFNEKKNEEEIQKLKQVYQQSLQKSILLKEYSKRIMKEQLLDKPKQTLFNQLLREKKKIVNNHILHEQKSLIHLSPMMNSNKLNNSKLGTQSLNHIPNSDFTPTIKSSHIIRAGSNPKIRAQTLLNKSPSILLQCDPNITHIKQ